MSSTAIWTCIRRAVPLPTALSNQNVMSQVIYLSSHRRNDAKGLLGSFPFLVSVRERSFLSRRISVGFDVLMFVRRNSGFS